MESLAEAIPALRAALLAWYRRHRRPLPWRAARDPYAVLVAELMLQQTRVEQALPYYRAFLGRFPTVRDLAAAPPDEVLALWQGLGYYRRALQLHAAARQVVERHGGRLPADEAALRALPGVGDYTAAAVLSIAYGRPLPALDGNALRVLARLAGETEPVDRAAVRARLRRLATALLDPEDPGAFNQALMDLGSTVCRPRRPDCGRCPLAWACTAHRRGLTDRIPAPRPRPRPREVSRVAAWVAGAAGVLLARRPAGGLLGGMWELPAVEGDHFAALQAAADRWGLALRPQGDAGVLELRFSHRTWRVRVVACALAGSVPAAPPPGCPYEEFRWAAPGQWAGLPLPSALRRWLQENVGKSRTPPWGEGGRGPGS